MSVSLIVGEMVYEVGAGNFFHAFFSTICFHLEDSKWGSVFPVLMNSLYQGNVPADLVSQALVELSKINGSLSQLGPDKVVWDINNLKLAPPWGDNISPSITNLSNYWVTSDGKELLSVLKSALEQAKETGSDVKIR